MALDIGVQEGKAPEAGGVRLDQIMLVSAIANEITRQRPGIAVVPRQFNAIIAAANDIVAEYAKPIVKATPGMGLEAWLDSDDTGASSLYMAWCLSAGQFGYWQGREQPEPAYPRDPDDLGRCIRLIEAVPEFGGKIPEMAHRGAHWLAVTTNWDRWVEMYYDENDDGTLVSEEMEAAYALAR